jgi:hypothetical protein
MALMEEEAGFTSFTEELPTVGEHFGEDLREPVRRHANGLLINNTGENTNISLGELGEHCANDVRFREHVKQGFLTAYIRSREFTEEHGTVIKVSASTVAIGAVLTGIAHLKHRQK